MNEPRDAREPSEPAVLRLAEDATGFGAVELRTARDLLLRPRAVLEAYLTLGATGGGRYARPLRFYLALCGVLMVILFLTGINISRMEEVPPDVLGELVTLSGKTTDGFIADVENWISLVLVPVMSLFYALGMVPLLKFWDRSTDWRRAFRACFALLCAWTIVMIPFSPWLYRRELVVPSLVFMVMVLIISFLRMGRGRWWRSGWGAAGRSLLLVLTIVILNLIGPIPIVVIALLGGVYAP